MMGRRAFLAAAATPLLGADTNAIVLDPAPLFDISPHLYMQFMEPLGITDSSVEAAWDYDADDWRKDFVDVVRDLAPGAMRFGGLFSRYYNWREGVGPVANRPRCATTSGAARRPTASARANSWTSAAAPAPSRSTASTS